MINGLLYANSFFYKNSGIEEGREYILWVCYNFTSCSNWCLDIIGYNVYMFYYNKLYKK